MLKTKRTTGPSMCVPIKLVCFVQNPYHELFALQKLQHATANIEFDIFPQAHKVQKCMQNVFSGR